MSLAVTPLVLRAFAGCADVTGSAMPTEDPNRFNMMIDTCADPARLTGFSHTVDDGQGGQGAGTERVTITGVTRPVEGDTNTSSVDHVFVNEQGVTDTTAFPVNIMSGPYRIGDPTVIENRSKIGLGVHEVMPPGYESEMEYYNTLDAGWYYDWWHSPVAGATDMDFVPMIWGDHVTTDALQEAVANSTTGDLLGFNEPDIKNQADMTVERAVKLWSSLENTGLRLGSPATGRRVLSDDSWFARFMAEAKAKDLRVDFIALHPYTTNPDVDALEDYIIAVYEKYKLPIWITEFALVDFGDWSRFTYEDNAKFLTQAFQMLDDLIFVERYAWFAPSPNGDGLGIKTSFLDPEGNRTAVGKAYEDLLSDVSDLAP